MQTNRLKQCLLVLLILLPSAAVQALTIVDHDNVYELSLADIRASADASHQMYSPFRRQQTLFQGYALDRFLRDHVGHPVDRATIHATDGYVYQISDIEAGDWMLVTSENGHPLSIREHGPLRLIETQVDPDSINNLALFDHWVWMIDRIVVDS